jgi:lipoate-protein ligase A
MYMAVHPRFSFPSSDWRLIDDDAYPVQLGLAIDEMLLEQFEDVNEKPLNTIRFYQFSPPAVVVGCNQDIREIDMNFIASSGLQLGRRITGGGAIIMGMPSVESQLGVSIVFRNTKDFPVKLGARYAVLSRPIVAALKRLGLPVEYQQNSDITLGGKKIAGQAMLSTTSTIFMHSTITIEYDLPTMLQVARITASTEKVDGFSKKYTTINEHVPRATLVMVKAALRAGFEGEYGASLLEEPLTTNELDRSTVLRTEKHSTKEYLLDMDGTKMGSCFL